MTPDRLTIAEIRARLADPRAVALLLGLSDGMRPQRGGVVVRCPAHAERTASCSLRVGRDGTLQVFCFGCGFGGDLISLCEAVRGGSRRDAIDMARELAGGGPALPARTAPERPSMGDDEFHRLAERILRAGRLDARWHSGEVRAAADYLDGRHLRDGAERDGWAALPRAQVLHQISTPEQLLRAGLYREDAKRGLVLSWPRHRLVIPWRDPDGRIQTLQRRLVAPSRSTPYVFCAGRPPLQPYGADVAPAGRVAFCEGAVDTLALRALLRRSGEPWSVYGLPGASSWRKNWAALAGGAELVALATDDDTAGWTAAWAMAVDLGPGARVRWVASARGAGDWADLWRARVTAERTPGPSSASPPAASDRRESVRTKRPSRGRP